MCKRLLYCHALCRANPVVGRFAARQQCQKFAPPQVSCSAVRHTAIAVSIILQVEKATTLVISGADKVQVGDFCAVIRRQRPPEPYKGKGIRYAGEIIKLKEGKGGSKKK